MHREEREFSIVLHLSAEFDDDYVGEEDGFGWSERFEAEIRPRLVQAVFQALGSDTKLSVTAAPRGRDPERGVDLDVVYHPS